MDIIIGPEILKSYKRLSYKVWYALAEFIDNSTQAYRNEQELLDKSYSLHKEVLTVKISINSQKIEIEDNSLGMDEEDLKRALRVGMPPLNTSGRSKYGLGMKTAAFWFGDTWTIKTKKIDSGEEIAVSLNLPEIIERINKKNEGEDIQTLTVQKEQNNDVSYHGTKITITDLNKPISQYKINKTAEYLRSIYRYDLQNGTLALYLNGERLTWSKDEFLGKLRKDGDTLVYKEFSFMVNEKEVSGWAGVLDVGSRKDAGFSLIQADRVIRGWPNGYRPIKLFGDQEGGVNDLTNQRLIGELFLDDFTVSHTKDEILFDGDEEEQIDEILYKLLIDLKRASEEYKKPSIDIEDEEYDYRSIVTDIFTQLQSPKFRSVIREYPVLDQAAIVDSNEELLERALRNEQKDIYETIIADIKIIVLINNQGSPYDPYLVLKYKTLSDSVYILLNRNHPHWEELTSAELVVMYIKDCILDGLAEWKAYKIAETLEPDTIKFIKDHYLKYKFKLS